jgi:hypothetical protein
MSVLSLVVCRSGEHAVPKQQDNIKGFLKESFKPIAKVCKMKAMQYVTLLHGPHISSIFPA